MTTMLTVRTGVDLRVSSQAVATALEELLWTLDGVESVMYRLDGEEHFQGLQVIASQADLPEQVTALCQTQGFLEQVAITATYPIHEEDWAESWKQYWHVHRVLPHVVIQPSWEPFTPQPEDIILKLDPGSAFGTGTHETTQLMLFLMDDMLPKQQLENVSLLDVGTGSGILAIYGAKLGVPDVCGIDNDPNAVRVAQENAVINEVGERAIWTNEAISEVNRPFNVVVANILASVLCEMMPSLKQVLKPQGLLMLSGITRPQLPQMEASLAENNLSLTRVVQKGEWIALVCQRKA